MGKEVAYEELQLGAMLGRGQFGAVFKGQWNNQDVAIKQIFTADADYDVNFYFSREVEILGSISHPNIVALLGVSQHDGDLFMVTELIQGSNLRDYLKEDIPWESRVKVALQVAHSISYLHQHKIIHRDVKTENVLIVQGSGTAKLCDFGFSRSNNDDAAKQKTFCGSEWFEAPEIMFCMDYDERVDIFSYGVVLCELISRKAPSMSVFRREVPGFGISSEEIRSRANEGCPPALVKLVIDTVEADPDHRPSFGEIIARLEEIYEKVAGKPYKEFEEELKQAEEKLQLFTLEEKQKAEAEAIAAEEAQTSQEPDLVQPPSPITTATTTAAAAVPQPGPELAAPTKPAPSPPMAAAAAAAAGATATLEAPSKPAPTPPATAAAAPGASQEKAVSYTSSTLLTVARMQLQAETAGPESRSTGSSNNLLKAVIPQKDQLAWRGFLVEFRSSVKVRDVQKSAAMGRIKTYRNCFPGCEAVDWLVKEKKMDRMEGLELCRILVKLNVVREATPTGTTGGDKVNFKDSKSELYRFSDDGIFFRREKAPVYLKK